MNYLLIWGILAILIIIILLILITRAYKSHELNIILMDHFTELPPAQVGAQINGLSTSDESLIHIIRANNQFVPTAPATLPNNVLELPIVNGTRHVYLIVGARYRNLGIQEPTATVTGHVVSLVDLVTGKLFKIIVATTAGATFTTQNSIVIPFAVAKLTATNVNANLKFNKAYDISDDITQFVFIGYQ